MYHSGRLKLFPRKISTAARPLFQADTMKEPHLLRPVGPVAEYSELIAALHEAGLRSGWLELDAAPAIPEALETAAAAGALRAVMVGGGRSLAAKPLRGAAVLRDLLREHFLGCRLVLVRGDVEAPLLRHVEGHWRVGFADGRVERTLTTQEMIATLRKPHPWGAKADDASSENDHE